MRTPLAILLLAAALLGPAALRGQGLVAIQNYSADFKTEQPLTFSFTGQTGYDFLNYKVNSPLVQDIESWYVQGGVGAAYTHPDRTTPWSFNLDTSVIHYIDGVPRFGGTFYNARAAFNFEHRFSERLKVSNNFYLTYGVDPSSAFGYGASTTLWNGQYLYGFNNFNVSYAWTPRLSTTTSYTIDGIGYQDDLVADPEDRYTHLFAHQFAYAISKRTSLTAEYRYRMATYATQADKNYTSHFALLGVDHAWSERMSGSVRGGAEFYDSERVSKAAPYAEAALNYAVAKQTMVRWFAALGFNGAELAAFNSRYGLNTGVQVNHNFTKRLSANAGASYALSQFDNGTGADATEHSALISAGIGYQLLENLNLNANYSYSTLQATDALREFDRHRVSLGATASF
ncbi:MAG: outer membrane beta-barrel protein [Prosthecobacter sp.]|uniref:outer membrane beta-barrel protein n=1 Tax=Prosthecobacter sp. TaxID=1965333 RepID=UPI00390431E8